MKFRTHGERERWSRYAASLMGRKDIHPARVLELADWILAQERERTPNELDWDTQKSISDALEMIAETIAPSVNGQSD